MTDPKIPPNVRVFIGTNDQLCNALREAADRSDATIAAICREAADRLSALEAVEDDELNALADSRMSGPFVAVDIAALTKGSTDDRT